MTTTRAQQLDSLIDEAIALRVSPAYVLGVIQSAACSLDPMSRNSAITVLSDTIAARKAAVRTSETCAYPNDRESAHDHDACVDAFAERVSA